MKIAILGSAPSSRLLAPFSDPSWEVWACSPQNFDLPRVDAWFELHNLDRKLVPENGPYNKVIAKHDRVYIAVPDGRLPHAIVFNPAPLLKKYGRWFFTSSLAWMMAFAIEQKPKQIGIWGVDLSAHEEYGYQRAGMHYFIQRAMDAGIEIVVPPQSDLAEPIPLYGFKEQWPMWQKLQASKKELDQRIKANLKIEEERKHERLILQGARDYWEYMKNTYIAGPDFWEDPLVNGQRDSESDFPQRATVSLEEFIPLPPVSAGLGDVEVQRLRDHPKGSNGKAKRSGVRAGKLDVGADRGRVREDSDMRVRPKLARNRKRKVQGLPPSRGHPVR